MNSHVNIGGSEVLSLKGALLVYQGHRRGFVAWHEARPAADGGSPYLGEAQALTTEFVRGLAQGLGSHIPPEILPENVLVRTADVLVWWSPARYRTMFFAQHDQELERLNGKCFPHPPLVWKVTGRDLWVRALTENMRPNATIKLMTAPYWNVDGETGWTCQGSMQSPEDNAVGSIDHWERAFFLSEFTHASGVARLTSHPGGVLNLWKGLADRRRSFPVKYLTPAKQTLVELVSDCGRDVTDRAL